MDQRRKFKVSRMKSFVDLEDDQDQRTRRAKRRSIDQREKRHQCINKRRNLSSEDSELSPIKEVQPQPSPEKKSLTDRLKIWQQARDARKRKEREKKKKRPGFKVTHASSDILAYNKPPNKLAERQHTKPVVEKKTTETKPVVEKKTTETETKDKPAGRVTRSQSQPKRAECKPKQPAKQTTRAASTKPQAASTKPQAASNKQPVNQPSQLGVRSKRSATATASHSQKTAAEPVGRVTRARSSAAQAAKPQKKKTKEPSQPPVSEEKEPNKKFVTQERGSVVPTAESGSFAPQDFTFNAPEMVDKYSFKPLSPATAASFLFPGGNSDIGASPALRRCSTPTTAHRTTNPVIHSPALSTIESGKKPGTTLSQAAVNLSQDLRDVASPMSLKRRRSSRKATSSQTDTESESEAPVKKAIKSHRRSTRRSRAPESTTDSDEIEGIIHEPKSLEANRRKSRRRSQVPVEAPVMNEQIEPKSEKKRKRLSAQVSSQSEDSDTCAAPIKTPRRRSTRRSVIVQDEHMSSAKESGAESDAGDAVATNALYTIPEAPSAAVRSASKRRSRASTVTEATENKPSVVQDSTISTTSAVIEPVIEAEQPVNEDQTEKAGETAVFTQEVESAPAADVSVAAVISNHSLSSAGTPKPAEGDGVFRTPSSTARKTRRKTVHGSLSRPHSARKTPKHRNSLMMKSMSPEERIDFMSHSPMVEMVRRTPKQTVPEIEPLPDFEELEHEVSSYESVTATESEQDEHGISSHSLSSSHQVVVVATVEPVPADQRNNAVNKPTTSSQENSTATNSASNIPAEVEKDTPKPDTVSDAPVPEKKPAEKPAKELSEKKSAVEVEHDVPYFRNLIASERLRLGQLCDDWEALNTPEVPEEASGEIRTTIGKAHLLMNQRFKQFEGLVDNCEFGRGEKETHCSDLQGFWDMIYFQVEDVDAMFTELNKLKARDWKSDKPQPVKKVTKKKVVKPAVKKPAGGAKSGFAAFRAKMAAQKKQEENEAKDEILKKQSSPVKVQPSPAKAIPAEDDPEENKENISPEQKVFDAGFFNISSPVKEPEFHCKSGSPSKNSKLTSLSNTAAANPLLSASPMLKAVLTKSARKSMSFDPEMRRLSRSRRCSWAMGDGPSTPSKAALVSLKLSPMAKVISTSEDGTTTTPTSVTNISSKISSVRRSLRNRRSSSQTSQSSTEESSAMDTGGDFAKFLMPTVQENATPMGEERELSFVKTPLEDVEMAVRTKRGLTKEFNKENASLTSSEDSLSVSTQSRRSVHFSIHSPPLEDQVHKLPATPFNKDSLVASSRVSLGDQKKNVDELLMMTPDGPGVQSSFSSESEDDSPSTKFSKLRVNYTPGVHNRTKAASSVDELLFTPVETTPLKERNSQEEELSPTIDLISFTPAQEKTKETPANTTARKSALKSSTKRRSVRLQQNNVSFL